LNSNTNNKTFTYFSIPIGNDGDDNGNMEKEDNGGGVGGGKQQLNLNDLGNKIKNNNNELLKRFFPDILKALGNRAIKENTPSLQELEQYLQTHIQELVAEERTRMIRKGKTGGDSNSLSTQLSSSSSSEKEKGQGNRRQESSNNPSSSGSSSVSQQGNFRLNFNFNNTSSAASNLPIVSQLIERGYLVDSNKWLKKRGFLRVGQEILSEIIKSLKADKLGMHETHFTGSGDIVQENSKRYEFGNEISNIHINSTIRNFIERKTKSSSDPVEFPLDINYEDLEIYETLEEIQVATVYCIDLSSTMKYASMYNDLSRIEAAKRALWSLYILNKKFFPLDSIYLLGFGSVASKIDTFDIPFLKTFETNADFLHYTNYQAAYRLAKKILKKNGAKNKRIVMITDGHPSACFIDNANEREKISKQRHILTFTPQINKN